MTKSEFEALIDKEVTMDTFNVYNTLYMAAPESIDKRAFVSMLNIKSIPEAPEAIERRQRREAHNVEIKAEITAINSEIDRLKVCRELWKTRLDEFEKREYKWYCEQIARERAKAQSLKLLYW